MTDRHEHQLYLNDVARRAEDRLAQQLADQAEEAEWMHTGRIRCHDCGTMVTTRTLVSLPEHGCSRRQQARRAREAKQ